MLSVKVATQSGNALKISGTVFEDSVQRVVEVDDYTLDLEPKGKLILFKNNDEPGVIGNVGSIIAKHNINISDFRLGRNNSGHALAVIKVDNEIPKALIEELSTLPACISVRTVTL